MVIMGVLLLVIIYTSFQMDQSLKIRLTASEVGCRFHATRGSMSIGVSKGGLPPDTLTGKLNYKDCQRVIENFHDSSNFQC